MVDYDGPDALKTYLNGLSWTALTEPKYYFPYEQINTEIANSVVIFLVSLTTERFNEAAYALHHHMEVQYINITKANLWPNLKYIIVNLWKLSSSNQYYSIPGPIKVIYAEKQKMFSIPITYTEILSI